MLNPHRASAANAGLWWCLKNGSRPILKSYNVCQYKRQRQWQRYHWHWCSVWVCHKMRDDKENTDHPRGHACAHGLRHGKPSQIIPRSPRLSLRAWTFFRIWHRSALVTYRVIEYMKPLWMGRILQATKNAVIKMYSKYYLFWNINRYDMY